MNKNITFCFIGDISFARDIREEYQNKNYNDIFNNTLTNLINTNITVLNLECSFGQSTQKINKDLDKYGKFPLIAEEKGINSLQQLNTNKNKLIISLSNNHMLDSGPENIKYD